MATVTVTEVTRFGETIIPRLKSIAAVGAEAVKSPNRVNAFEARYEFALELFTQFQNMYNRVSVASDKTEALEKLDKIVTTVDELLFEIKEKCITIKKLSADSPPVTQSPITTSNVRLPKINVPVFSGDIKLFSSFFEIFSDLIHKNSSLSEIEKFHYLHTSLKGEASTLIQGLSLTAANYSIALDTLRNRYMNKRLIAHNHLNILKSLKPVIPGKHLSRSLRSVTELFLEQYKAFNALQLSAAEQLDFLWFDSLLNKLDSKTRERFELTLQNNQQIPTFKQLTEFLDTQCRALEITFLESSSGSNIPEDKKSEERLSGRKPSSYTLLANVNPNQPLCPFCKGAHFLSYCKSFLEKSPNERFQIAKQAKLCLNCLRCNHTLKNCSSSNTCKTCKFKHHTLLHFHKSVQSHDSLQSNIPIPNTSSKVEPTPMLVNALTNTLATRATVLLSTALVDAVDAKGNIQTLRILLDSGSQANFITEQCIKKLGLSCIPSLLPIQGLSQMSSITPRGKTECYIQPSGKTLPQMSVEAIVLREICGAMPSVKLAEDTWEHIAILKLADPDFGTPRSIDMLLGAEVFPQVLLEGRLKGLNNSSPVAINTIFGWILMGKINVRHCETLHSFHVTSSLDTLDKTISHFWEVENVPQKGISSLEDDLAEDIFVNSYTRTDQGRFSVALPFRVDNRSFPSSRAIAINRFRSLERRLIRNPTLRNSYVDFMSDYLQSNHMEKLDSFLDDFDSYFIPHHCVIKPDSTTTKLRVVFDASAKLDGGISLNDTLYVGPKLQKDIFSILSRFRLHKIAITSDIKQMYRQILVHPEHRKYQLIVWRFSPEDDLETYQLNTVTYGLSSAPYLAQRTIIELAKLEKDKFPIAAQIASTDIYVDDIVTGCDSLAEAEIVKCQLISLFKSGGFELRKWSSNFPDFLSDVQATPSSSLCLDSSENMGVKILGLHWKPDIDCFIFRVKPIVRDCTKRSILSEVSRIFDPLGFLAPLTFFVKHLIQILWTLKLEWDETPPSDILFRWSQFKSELHHLEWLRINRCLSIKNASSCQLHGFCDASEAGYAAVTYFRIVRNNKIYVSFNLS